MASPVIVRLMAEHNLGNAISLDPAEQLLDAEIRSSTPSSRKAPLRERGRAPKLACSLDRDHVDRLLDDTDDGAIAPRIRAHAAQRLFLGQVPALAAEPNACLHVLDRTQALERILWSRRASGTQGVARKPPDEQRELRDKVLDGQAEHAAEPIRPFRTRLLAAGQQAAEISAAR